MSNLRSEIAAVLETGGGVVARRQHPELVEGLNWLVCRGELIPVLPGVYAPPTSAERAEVRIRAALLWDPDAVVVGPMAARLSFWPQLAAPVIGLAVTRHHRITPTGFEVVRREVPPELITVRGRLRLSCPALTALDLCDSVGGDGIDTALRTRATTLEGIRAALARTPGRSHNGVRRRLLLDSRDAPWSAAERLGHRVLRAGGITGWKSNVAVVVLGQTYFVDVAWEQQLLALEIDGRLHESDVHLFESDRWRQNALVLQGWRVLRCTWRMLQEHPDEVVRVVRASLNA